MCCFKIGSTTEYGYSRTIEERYPLNKKCSTDSHNTHQIKIGSNHWNWKHSPKKEHAKHYGGKKCEICSRDAHRSTCVSKLYPTYWKQSTNYLRATLDGSVNSQHSSFMCSAAGSSMWGSARVPGRNVWKLA
jgi:hypothetical protein